MSANDLRRTITEGLEPYLVEPQVSVGIKAIRSQKVVILGEVAQPGVYTMTGPMHILEAVSMAGGFGLSSDRSRVLHMRVLSGELASAWVDINELLQRRGSVESNPVLRTGDIVYVPPTAIADLARFARQVESIIRPVLLTQQAVLLGYDVKEAFEGDRIPSRSTIIIPAN